MDRSLIPASRTRGGLPSWAANLAGFGLLIALVLAVFFWQLIQTDRNLHHNTLARARMIAAIIEEHLSTAAQTDRTLDTITASFLLDKTRFIEYLNDIDPLQAEEITALAEETGLLGIGLIHKNGVVTGGPANWIADHSHCGPERLLVYDPADRTAQLSAPPTMDDSPLACILVGFNAHDILTLRAQTALPVLLANLSRLPGIHSVRMEASSGAERETVRLTSDDQGRAVAEVRLGTSSGELVLGLDAASHQIRLTQLRQQFLLFSALLLGLGLFFSWLLYRRQQADLYRLRNFERLLAREHEAAALGRATAAIAHEVRNPLNAINMGLQRLELESPRLDPEQRELLQAMQEAVRRAGGIVSELQRFTRQLTPRLRPVSPTSLLRQLAPLYRQRCVDQGIEIQWEHAPETVLAADPDLLNELLENLLKNSIEAQPDGGFIRFDLSVSGSYLSLSLTNGGCRLTPDELARLGEPYFTTKTRGAGLGLALCRRIAEAHGGTLEIVGDPVREELTVTVRLPLAGPDPTTDPNPPSGVHHAHSCR
ncbi:MAG: sensor histidine kinase [Desulfobulbus sp.]